jgi:hypothetical protein
VTLPDTVATIDAGAFNGCASLTTLTITGSVSSIQSGAFEGCSKLVSITIAPSNSSYCSINGVVFDQSQSTLVQYPPGRAGSYSIPNTVTTIGQAAFYECNALTSVTIPNSVTILQYSAFAYCANLTSAIFLGNAPSVAGMTFDYGSSDFTLYYFDGAGGFTSPTWNGYTAVDIGAYSSVAPWLLSNGFAFNANLQCAPNGDGVPLLMDYALNLDPTQNQSGSMPQPVISGNQMSLTYYAGSAGITYSVEASTDLQNWSTAGVTTSAPDANNFCTATVPITSSRGFMRLVVLH